MKILIIEDSERLRRSLELGLNDEGFIVDLAADGRAGLEFLRAYRYDAVILDLMLPEIPGLEVLRTLREEGCDVHVLILSAKDQVEDRVQGLELGADDYLVKPFAFNELCARLNALGRRIVGTKTPTLRFGDLEINTATKTVVQGGEPVHLTRREYLVFAYLARRRGRVVSQRQLTEQLYDSTAEVGSNVIEVVISSLRKKLQRPGEPQIIRTRRGFGYIIED